MDNKRDVTKILLVNSFKKMVLTKPFEKITIKMITDDAGVIRPTFYNYFQDKYEVLEWIFTHEIADKMNLLLENKMESEAIKMLFICLEKEREFYKRAFLITGPNSFYQLLEDFTYKTFLHLLAEYPLKPEARIHFLTSESIATYYTFSICEAVRAWVINDGFHMTSDEIYEAYIYLIHHSLLDTIDMHK
ncbi:MAG TPA: TetR/AcrR family transcriptional regulator C-terminal domain-containing protein [Lachnospiraceae bacterium]|nr:TetR/AcrR family transcriptional regulator C-terminal domain-containing protein [Lachnospiraceae bacterium]